MVYKLLQKSRGTMGQWDTGQMGHGTNGTRDGGDTLVPTPRKRRKSHDLKIAETVERMNKMNTLNKMNSVNTSDENER